MARRVNPPRIELNDGGPALMSPRAVRPASLQDGYFEDPYAQQGENDALNIDLDSHDPYRYGTPSQSSVHSSDAGHQAHLGHSPFADQNTPRGPGYQTFDRTQSNAPAYSAPQEDEDVFVERYLLENSPQPVYQAPNTYQQQQSQPYDYSPVQYLSDFPSKEQDYDAASLSSRSGKSFASQEEDEPYNPHFGPAPIGPQLRRNKTKKRVALTHGNLVLDCPIPSRLTGFLPRKDQEEFRFMRYSAVTCDPDNFEKCQFTVRPAMLNRETELCIAITMYNEDEVLFCRTLHHVMKNISHLCTREKSSTWGPQGWKKVVVCIIVDGRKNVHPRVLDCLSALGVYQPGVAKNIVEQDGEQKSVVAHLYEYTTQLSVTPDLKFRGLEKGIVPTQIIFCMKENNAKKINSHRWFFNAFAPMLQPNICVLLDVGTLPGPKSLYYLWKTFNLNSNVGGACGEIVAMKGKLGTGLLNPLVAAQNFEYKISNILDKPTESVFGYISVLPGAFSAYRYIALLNDACGQGPLASYFKGETLAGHDADVFSSNMYLAEDRILCWELVAKRNSRWVLKYVRSAQGETDVPDTAAELISQRRRWLNGSFFAAIYALTHVFQIFQSEHTALRKIALIFEAFYNFLNLLFAWFSLGTFYTFFMILTSSLEDPSFNIKGIKIVNIFAQYAYAGALISVLLFAMGNRPQSSKWKYMGVMAVFCLLTCYMLAAAAICCVRAFQNMSESSVYAQIILSLVVTYGVYLVSSILALDPWHILTSMPQYLVMQSVYINIFNVYAFANLHDFSWGTKSLDVQQTDLGIVRSSGKDSVEVILPTSQTDIDAAYDEALHSLKTRPRLIPPAKSPSEREVLKQDYYRSVRTNVLLAWTLSNAVLAAVILHGDTTSTFALQPSSADPAASGTSSRLVRRADDPASAAAPTGTTASTGDTKTVQIYMVVILVFVTFMSVVRFIGSTTYLVLRLFAG